MKRGGPLRRKTPLRAKTPLRSIAKLKRGGPIKVRPKPPKPAAEAAHVARVAAMPCCVPGCGCPATVHHVTSDGYKRIARTDRRVVPLCPKHHQVQNDPKASDPQSVERLGHAGFTAKHGIDLLQLADRLWEESSA